MVAYLHPSSYEEWQPTECIIGIISVMHAPIGQLQYEGRSTRNLVVADIFFYDYIYILTDRNNTTGYLEELPL